jgi:ATP-dependent RNA helicase DeaD
MTNGTTPTENGVADVATMFAATTLNDTNASTSEIAPEEPKAPSFNDFGLHPDVKLAIDDMGYFSPTPVQVAVFQPVTDNKDLLVQSKTGTGKTTAFALPIINRLVPTHRAPQALILAPTRELALQVARESAMIGKHRGILIEPVYGGAPIGKQIKALRDGVHVIVGTPGRVLDHIGRRTLDLRTIQTFVLDECDEMLSMGFLEDIEKITSFLPDKHQTLLFSATMPDEVSRYARRHMTAPEQISLSRDSVSVAEIHHAYYIVSGIARSRDLLKIIFAEEPESAIIFCNTRDETTMVAKFLQKQGLDAEPLSSDLTQADRERVMNRMKQHNLRFLCATDVAARGIDISNLSHVINYSVPEAPEIYVHRTGRTGRAGKRGTALSLVGPRELGNFRYVRLQFGIKPEERLLPKDDIFIGKLKHPLPPVGVPQPPDPIQILLRGVSGSPSDLERQIFEKLLAKADGKRVLAQLVADKLNTLTTKTGQRPPRRERPEREDRGEREERAERPEREERGERRPEGDGERPRRFDRDREDRPRRFDGERGERGFDRDRGERGERDRGERDRGERDRGERGERDRGDRGERRFDRDRDRGERRFDRDRDRDREGRRDRHEHRDRDRHEQREPVIAQDTTVVPAEAVAVVAEPAAAAEAQPERHERPERERHERRDRHEHRDRQERREHVEAAPEAEAEAPSAPATTGTEEVARAALERADRGKRRGSKTAPTEETREFWETWAENKSARPAAAAEAEPAAEVTREERPRRDRDRGRGRDRDRDKDKRHEERGRGKRDTLVYAGSPEPAAPGAKPAAAADGNQARLFVSLGKKHGVSADDLRTLLAGPIGGDTSRIGSVSLRDSHAHVRVPEEAVEAIISGVHGTLHNDHNVTVERARS